MNWFREVLVLTTTLALCGCHFHVGLGPEATEIIRTEKCHDQDTIQHADGSQTITRTDVVTEVWNDETTKTVTTVTTIERDPQGYESRSVSTTTNEKSANGHITTSSSTSGS